jgi:hypothetical protein
MHKPLKVIRSFPDPHIPDLVFRLCALFDPTLDSLDVSTIMVLHPTHSPMPLHTQMILGNFPQSPQTHQHYQMHKIYYICWKVVTLHVLESQRVVICLGYIILFMLI